MQEYDVIIDSSEQWRWGFSWCAINDAVITEILQPLRLEFHIDGVPLRSPHIFEYDDTSTSGWTCRRWQVLLKTWPENKQVVLTINYTLNESIYDGLTRYPAGTYQQVMNVLFEP
jgi:hypothetical protein